MASLQEKKKTILLKMSGELFTITDPETGGGSVRKIVTDIASLAQKIRLCLVIGGGNFFRGEQESKALDLPEDVGHEVGMLATIMNGKILQALLEQHGCAATILTALPSSGYRAISHESIDTALAQNRVIIFVGGTGNPYFSTDTAAVIRGLQIGAWQLWKATKVDGIYDKDPRAHRDAKLFKSITYDEALNQKIGVMDLTAMTLAAKYKLPIRVFNLFASNALGNALNDPNFGSLLQV